MSQLLIATCHSTAAQRAQSDGMAHFGQPAIDQPSAFAASIEPGMAALFRQAAS